MVEPQEPQNECVCITTLQGCVRYLSTVPGPAVVYKGHLIVKP